MNKLIELGLILMVTAAVFFAGAMWQKSRDTNQHNKELVAAQVKYEKDVKALEARKAKREIVYRDREVILNEDKSDCANTDMPVTSQQLLSQRPAP